MNTVMPDIYWGLETKKHIVLFCTSFLCISLLTFMPQVSASSDISVNYSFDKNPCYQGDTVILNLTIKNNSYYLERINSTGVHFDWMTNDGFFWENGTYTLESNQIITIFIHIAIPRNVGTGLHSYHININYQVNDFFWSTYVWDDSKGDFNILLNEVPDGGTVPNESIFPSFLFIIIAIGIIIFVISIVSAVIMKKRGKERLEKVYQSRSQPISSQSTANLTVQQTAPISMRQHPQSQMQIYHPNYPSAPPPQVIMVQQPSSYPSSININIGKVGNDSTIIQDSIIQRSNVGSTTTIDPNFCPHCKGLLNLQPRPEFCPTCKGRL